VNLPKKDEEMFSLGKWWEYLLQNGRKFGLLPYGVTAMQTLRLEKAFPLYGNDINEDYTPFHVGLDRWIKFTKREFIGRDALLEVQERKCRLPSEPISLMLTGPRRGAARCPWTPAETRFRTRR
jgi:glycine cleavage system aminomethyltransferase T